MKKKLHKLLQPVWMLCLMGGLFVSVKTNAQNYALKMDNTSDAVMFDNVALSPGSSWTAEMWVKRTAQSSFSTLIDGATSKFTLETWAANNAWTYKVGFSKKGSGDQAFNYIVPLNVWTHLAYVCNGTSVSLYVNGVLTGTVSQAIDLPLKGFGLLGNPNEAPMALLDEVRYWKGVRTAAEIVANMNKSVDISSPNLIGYWYFDDRATKITDLSASGLNGTNSGCTYVANDNSNFTSSHSAMTVESILCSHKNEYLLTAGSSNQEILCVQVNTTGVTNPVSLSSLTINLNGTTNLSNVAKVAVSTTGNSSTFSSGSLLGTKITPAANDMTFSGNIVLKPGKNYFWVMLDLSPGVSDGSVFDASCVSAVVNAAVVAPVDGNPTGNRIVQSEVSTSSAGINIVPKPGSVVPGVGTLNFTNQFKIKYSGVGVNIQADSLAAFLNRSTGYAVASTEGADEAASISLSLITDASLGNEGYKLDVTSDRVKIQSQTVVGLFWGIQSLRQLFPPAIESKTVVANKAWTLPVVSITDVPRFSFRSVMLDVGRYYFPPAFVKKYIDMLSMYKINSFHWHLTEDQGWRIEIKKYPKLNTISAYRTCSGVKYGGYYTQDEVRDIVAYAASKNITIIPEIEMPGHSVAVLASYPELACTSAASSFSVRCAWGISTDILCGGKKATRNFLKDVLTEVVDLFPGKYVHIGGDEAPKTNWNTCTDCMHRIDSLGITGADQTAKSNTLQKELVEDMAQFLSSKGKTLIGWDEITHGGIPTGATVQAWNVGVNVGSIAGAGHDVIMSTYNKIYLDSKQSTAPGEYGASWMGYNTLDVVYNFDPMPSGLTAAQKARVIGAEACLWTEEIPTGDIAEYMLTPRMQAFSERSWSPASLANFEDFKTRILPHYERFSLMGYNSRRLDAPSNTASTIKSCEAVTLKSPTMGTSYFWNDENHATTREITVTKSGKYKCYVNFLGTIIENTFDVTIDAKNSTPQVRKVRQTNQTDLTAVGDYDSYKWYADAGSVYPLSVGNSLTLPSATDDAGYYLSAVQFKNNLNSLQLDGADDVVEIASSNFLNAAKTFTFEAWVKVRSWRTWDVIFCKYLANTNRVALELGNSGELYCHMSKGASAYGQIANVLSLNTWTHLALVYDGNKANNAERLKLYVNGDPRTLSFTGTVQNTTPTVANPLRLGYATQNPSMNYADVRFWSTARTADEVKNSMTKLSSYDSGLKLYYPMDQVSDTAFYDVTAGVKASLKNSGSNFVSVDAVPGLLVAGCETQRWKMMDIVKDVTSVGEIRNDLGAEVYPNPSSGEITLDVTMPSRNEVQVKIYNLTGQVFVKETLSGDTFKKNYSLKSLNKGVYFISVEAANAQKVMKVVLK